MITHQQRLVASLCAGLLASATLAVPPSRLAEETSSEASSTASNETSSTSEASTTATVETTTRYTDDCAFHSSPPPPVTTSEVVAPGSTTPTPPAEISPAPGGEKMGECGVIRTDSFQVPEFVNASSWIVFDTQSGDIIAAKDPHGRYRPASIAKVLLALVALDELELDDVITADYDDAAMEGSRAGIIENVDYTVRELLLGLILNSGNDCANALVRALGGQQEAVSKINAKVEELQATSTHIVNPSGLDAAGQMTSAFDMALFYTAAFDNQDYRELSATAQVELPGSEEFDLEPFTMGNDNKLLGHHFPGALGGKTGFTDDARHTFAGIAERQATRLGVVVLDAHTADGYRAWQQAGALLEEGFRQLGLADPTALATLALPETTPESSSATSTETSATPIEAPADFEPVGNLFHRAEPERNLPWQLPTPFESSPSEEDSTVHFGILALILAVVGFGVWALLRLTKKRR